MSARELELYSEVRRGLILIIRALLRYYHLSWRDFLPDEAVPAPEIAGG